MRRTARARWREAIAGMAATVWPPAGAAAMRLARHRRWLTGHRACNARTPLKRGGRRVQITPRSRDRRNAARRPTIAACSRPLLLPRRSPQRRRRPPRRPPLGRGPLGLQPPRSTSTRAAVAFPADADDVAAAVAYAREAGLRVAPQATGHNQGAARRPGGHAAAQRQPRSRRSASTRPPSASASAPASSGTASRRGSPPTAWPACTARRPTSASPATRSAAAWAGWRASTACRPTPSRRSSSSPPTASSCAPTPSTSRTCSGRCAAAAATSAS